MNKNVLVIHGFGLPNSDGHLLTVLKSKGFNIIYPNWFDWNKKFNLKNFEEYFKEIKKEKKIDWVIGISMGGFLVIRYSKLFPDAKFLLISSSYNFKPKFPFNLLLALPKIFFVPLISILKLAGKAFLNEKPNNSLYDIFYLIRDLDIKFILSILEYIKKEDISELISTLTIPVYTLNGSSDPLMPAFRWDIFKNVKQIPCKGSHYNSVNRESLKEIEKIFNI